MIHLIALVYRGYLGNHPTVADTTSELLNKVKNIMTKQTSKKVVAQNPAVKQVSKPAKFEWNEKNEKVISDTYVEQLEKDHAKANGSAFLTQVSMSVGAKSAQAVRSKLSSLGVYKPIDKAAVSIAKPRNTKPKMADKIRDQLTAAGVDLSEEAANSLANSNAAALKAVIEGLDMLDAPAPAVKKADKK